MYVEDKNKKWLFLELLLGQQTQKEYSGEVTWISSVQHLCLTEYRETMKIATVMDRSNNKKAD